MIKHFLKIAFRNLSRQKVLAVINVSGLSIGLACFILFMLYAVSEFSYDRFHSNKNNIYRVYLYSHPKAESPANYDPYLPMPLGAALKQDLPDIKTVVRMQQGWSPGMVRANGKISRQKLSFADPELFSVFSFALQSGAVSKDPTGMVLSAKKATDLFGNKNPVGEIVEAELDGKFQPFTVTGVVKEIPSNSSLQFDMLINFDYLPNTNFGKESIDNWNMGAYQFYVQLQPGSKLAQQQDKLIAFRKKYYPNEETRSREAGWKGEGPRHVLRLQALTDIHTNIDLMGTPAVASINPENIWTLVAIAAGLLLIACINFTTLAIGRSASRAREVGIRKVVGSMRRQLILQFIAEAILLTTLSIALGLLLANLLLPWFNQLAGTELQFSFTQFPEMVWLILSLALIVGIIAGSYPALILSGFNPIEVLKQKIKVGGSNLFTSSLVTFQFVLSIGLIACTLVMMRQTNYLVGKNPGFNKENVVVVDASATDTKKINPLFKQAVSKLPTVTGVAGSELGLGQFGGWSRTGFNYNGKQKNVWVYPIDHAYLDVTGIKLLAGRNFDPAIASDTINSIIINEQWLQDFAYRLNPGWWVFAAAGLLSLIIALITIGFHAVKASLMNPVKSLRTE